MATTQAQERGHYDRGGDDRDDGDQIEFGHPSPSDSYDELEEQSKRPELTSRHAAAPDADALDVEETLVDRAGPSLAEVQSLGPVEELDTEMFEKTEREVPPGSGTTKQIFVCKFCSAEFNYMMRDMHGHQDLCAKYPGRASMVREMVTVPDDENPSVLVDKEVVGETVGGEANDADEVKGLGAPVVDDEATEDQEEQAADDVDMGLDYNDENDETQMLDDEGLAVVVPDRVEMASNSEEPRPTLKVARPNQLESEMAGNVDMAVETDVEDSAKRDERGSDEEEADERESPSPGAASETASTGSTGGREAYRASFNIVSGDDGVEYAKCIHCGRKCSSRGGAMATHLKACSQRPAQGSRVRLTPQDEKGGLSVQLMTPKKKATKRRISGHDFDLVDDEAGSQVNDSDTESYSGAPQLRRSKRIKVDGKGKGASLDTESADRANFSGTTEAAASTKSAEANLLEHNALVQFALVGNKHRMKCYHCNMVMNFGESIGTKHLLECDAYKTSHAPSTPAPRNQKRPKAAEREVMRHPEKLQIKDIANMDHESVLEWIFGSRSNVDKMRSSYEKSQMVVRSSVTRFAAVEAELCGLDVVKLLASRLLPLPITALVPPFGNDPRHYRMVPCSSADVALSMYESNIPIVSQAPSIVTQVFAPHLGKELSCGVLVAPNMHSADLLCGRGEFEIDWQYDKTDMFVVCLHGKALWQFSPSNVDSPPACFNLSMADPSKLQDLLDTQITSLGVGTGRTSVSVPSDKAVDFNEDDEMNGSGGTASSVDHMVTDAGSIVYVPAGMWYRTKVLEGDVMWLRIRMTRVTVGELTIETVRQLVMSQRKLRHYLQEDPSTGVSVPQEHLSSCLRAVGAQLIELSKEECLPGMLVTPEGSPSFVVCADGGDYATRIVEVDLTRADGFQGGSHIRLLKGSMFRVNPLVVLFSVEELTKQLRLSPSRGVATVAATPGSAKKALTRKVKKASAAASGPSVSALATQGSLSVSLFGSPSAPGGNDTSQGLYVMRFGMAGGGDVRKPRLEVRFRCNGAQQAMVNWIRSRDTADGFLVSELAKVLADHQGGNADADLLRTMLRFLCSAGYLGAVEVPL